MVRVDEPLCPGPGSVACLVVKSQLPLSHLMLHFTVEAIHSASNLGAPLLGPAIANIFRVNQKEP